MVGLLTNFFRFVSQSEIMPGFKSVRLRKPISAPDGCAFGALGVPKYMRGQWVIDSVVIFSDGGVDGRKNTIEHHLEPETMNTLASQSPALNSSYCDCFRDRFCTVFDNESAGLCAVEFRLRTSRFCGIFQAESQQDIQTASNMAAPVDPATRKKVLKVVFFSLLLDLVRITRNHRASKSLVLPNSHFISSRTQLICHQLSFTFILPLFPSLLQFYREYVPLRYPEDRLAYHTTASRRPQNLPPRTNLPPSSHISLRTSMPTRHPSRDQSILDMILYC
jgi:hypothetical protein